MGFRGSHTDRPARASRSGRTVTRRRAKNATSTAEAFEHGEYNSPDLATALQDAAVSPYSRNNPSYSKAARKLGPKKIALYVLAAIVVVIVGAGTALAVWIGSLGNQLTSDLTDEELAELADLLATETNYDEPFYILLIGSDARSDDASMGARSDTNIVVRVDLTEGTITLISIPRDTMIELEGYGTVKFNAAYAYGGAAATIRAANELLGITISHYAEIDFEGLVDLIDAIGGVYLYVDSTIDDSKAGDVVVEEGWQTLDGEAALVYARSRQYTDGDFTRTSHQRELVSAVIEKVLTLSLTELPSVLEAAVACVTTDLDLNDILELVVLFMDVDDLTIYSCMVPSVTGYIDGVSYVFTDEDALAEMMELVEAGEDPSGITGSSSSAYATSGATSTASGDDDDDSDSTSVEAGTEENSEADSDTGSGYSDSYGSSSGTSSGGSSSGLSGSTGTTTSDDSASDGEASSDDSTTSDETSDDAATEDESTDGETTTDGSTTSDETSDDSASSESSSDDSTSESTSEDTSDTTDTSSSDSSTDVTVEVGESTSDTTDTSASTDDTTSTEE